MTKYPSEFNSELYILFSAKAQEETQMKKNAKNTTVAQVTAQAKVNNKEAETKKKQLLDAQKVILAQFVAQIPDITDEYVKAGAENTLDNLMSYLYGEANKMRNGASVNTLYVPDATVMNWIKDFYREGHNEKKSVPVTKENKADKPMETVEKFVVDEKYIDNLHKTKDTKPVVAPKKNTDVPAPTKKGTKTQPKAENEIYALSAKGFFVLCRAKSEAEAIELATAKAKEESGRQRLKLTVDCVASRVCAKAKTNDVVTLHPAKTEADTTCFVYTDLEGNYGVVFAPNWHKAEETLCDTIINEYDEFTDEIWNEIGNVMVFQN